MTGWVSISTPVTVLDDCPRCGAKAGEYCFDLRQTDPTKRRSTARNYHPFRPVKLGLPR